MAEALVLLNTVAASSQIGGQLVTACCALYGIYRKVKDAPSTIQEQAKQLDQLASVAGKVNQNPKLQTDLVASILGSCLLQVQELQLLLEERLPSKECQTIKRLQKALVAVATEKKVKALFQQLDSGKVSLMLCIQDIELWVLFNVHPYSDSGDLETGERLLKSVAISKIFIVMLIM